MKYFPNGTTPLHKNQTPRKYAISHLMLYGHRLPAFYQKNFSRLKMERESDNKYWKIICDMYRHIEDRDLFWLDTYDSTLSNYFTANEYNGTRWELFTRLYPIMISLYGIESVQEAITRNQQKGIPIPDVPFHYEPLDLTMMDYRITNLSALGLDFNLIENINRLPKEIQNKYLNTIYAYITKEDSNGRFKRENMPIDHNISRHDFWYAHVKIKDIPFFLSVCSKKRDMHYAFEWLLQSTSDPLILLEGLAHIHKDYENRIVTDWGANRLNTSTINGQAICSSTPYHLILPGLKPNDSFNSYLDRLVYNNYRIEKNVIDLLLNTTDIKFSEKVEMVRNFMASHTINVRDETNLLF